ncbi:hypothetical protein Ahy_B05g075415 [Arachis hypogaea]|uniref:Uncharacterized protein n=1 Tax=Arachis hypogaea TaxID=3818 RepID=A0A444Z174_ARAHY|nr:hypothetical protein Ahy_B05g075415 [Arachis hypogaea]
MGREEDEELHAFQNGAFEVDGGDGIGAVERKTLIDREFLDRYVPMGRIQRHTTRDLITLKSLTDVSDVAIKEFYVAIMCIGKECTFFSWADGVAETEEAEVARLKMKISTLKTKLVYAKCKLLVAVIFGVLGWFMVILMVYLWVKNGTHLRLGY